MPVLHLLGTGAAVSDPGRTTTMLALESGGCSIVVDCGGDVIQRFLAAGLDADGIEGLIVTHEHPDHCSGFPLFMERIWLMGRRRPILVYGIAPAIAQARRAFEAFDTSGWEGLPEIRWREVAHESGARVLQDERWRITAAPGIHGVPVVGIRVEAAEGGVAAYSCDTAKSPLITELSRGADLLVHEATNTEQGGHTTNEQAAEVARDAGAGRLVLVHLPPGTDESQLAEARRIFPRTEYGVDGASYRF
ncbi:MAG TPA: MBL fold metallo-hydrolase [Longimicrobium sp.]|nr:MBL fold metallo-hydrolase [Longimicrobium sp.]